MNTYKITMDDGRRIDKKARNAADAIQGALSDHLGHRVASCYSGMTDHDASTMIGAMPGFIHHDIPVHDPMTVSEPKPRTNRRDDTAPMFNDTRIELDSERALQRRSDPL